MKLSIIYLIVRITASASAESLFHKLAKHLAPPTTGLKEIPGENPLKYCHEAHSRDIFTIEKINLTPNRPIRGKRLTIQVVVALKEMISQGAHVDVSVKYGLITLMKHSLNICDHVHELGLECPINQGKLTLTKVIDVPKFIPPGKYTLKCNVALVGDRPITCLTGTIAFSG
ncbi:putative Phosphatidylglycerol/phosphatidylinositol transfer protein [Tuber indicum]|nr:putative Phosphatidylglycerol/phosphatidylinositol transfer protein [Tuber indicum]